MAPRVKLSKIGGSMLEDDAGGATGGEFVPRRGLLWLTNSSTAFGVIPIASATLSKDLLEEMTE